jgi:hypothetical protein
VHFNPVLVLGWLCFALTFPPLFVHYHPLYLVAGPSFLVALILGVMAGAVGERRGYVLAGASALLPFVHVVRALL